MRRALPVYLKIKFKKALFAIKRDGLLRFLKKAYNHLISRPLSYQTWIKQNESFNGQEIKKQVKEFKYKPKISIITPVYNVDPKWLNKCIKSVINQFYDNWELCLYDDASTNRETVECLKKWERSGNPKIKIAYGKENKHISAASNEALKMAEGEFIALLDNDDELSPNALYEVIKLLNEHPEADMIYSDEDKLTLRGKRVDPFFKPDWSPDLFLSMMYTCHLGVYRKKIIDAIGGFRVGYEGSQDYDLVLRFIEKTIPGRIYHIPKVLYHWRQIPGSAAAGVDAKDYADDKAVKALNDYLCRNSINGEAIRISPGRYRVKRAIVGSPKVSIIIPFRDKAEVLRTCIDSVLSKTTYTNYEIILVNNQSVEKETISYLDKIKINPKIKILLYDKPFNYSAINNYAAKAATGKYLLFLNNDMEVINRDWLSNMVEHIQRGEVGIVGAKLIYPNNTIQHAGVVIGLGNHRGRGHGVAGHPYRYYSTESGGYFSQINVIRNYSAVTAACMLTKKDLFEKIGGFDEENLPIAFNDVDFCLRAMEAGYLIVYTPFAQLYHHESLSRGNDDEEKDSVELERIMRERDYMYEKWLKYIMHDPYYNPNLTKSREDFSLKK